MKRQAQQQATNFVSLGQHIVLSLIRLSLAPDSPTENIHIQKFKADYETYKVLVESLEMGDVGEPEVRPVGKLLRSFHKQFGKQFHAAANSLLRGCML